MRLKIQDFSERSFFLKKVTEFLKKMKILKIGKSSNFVAEYDKNSQSSQNFQTLIFIIKIRWVFPEKTWVLQNRFRYQNCRRMRLKIQGFSERSIFLKKVTEFLKKIKILKIGKSSKIVAEYDKKSQSSQNVQNLFFIKKN